MAEKEQKPAVSTGKEKENKIRYHAVADEFYRALLIRDRTTSSSRFRRWVLLPILLVICLFYSIDVVLQSSSWQQSAILAAICLVLLAVGMLSPIYLCRKVAKRFGELPGEFVVEVGKKAIYIDYEGEHTELDFLRDAVQILDSRSYFIVGYRKTRVFVIPKKYMTDQQIEDARHVFIRKIPGQYKTVKYRRGRGA